MLWKGNRKVISRLLVFSLLLQLVAIPLPVVYAAEGELTCSIPEHTHTADCLGEVVCGQTEREAHSHSAACYAEDAVPVCGLPEESHVHTQDCLGAQICTETESEGHTHGEGCFETVQKLICTPEEGEGHTHDASCYEAAANQICTETESEGHSHSDSCREITCGKAEGEGHTHGSTCYDAAQQPVCGLTEEEGHTHADTCRKVICGQPEHTHDPQACYTQQDAAQPEEERSLYEQLLACESVEAINDLLLTADPEELTALTVEQLTQLDAMAQELPCGDEDLREETRNLLMMLNGGKPLDVVVYAGTDPVELDVSRGKIHITPDTITGYDSAGNMVEAPTANGCIITGEMTETYEHVVRVEDGAAVDITLSGVNIKTEGVGISPFVIGDTGSRTGDLPLATVVRLHLKAGTINTLTATGYYSTALRTNQTSKLYIDGSGTLNATGADYGGSGIGGGSNYEDYHVSDTWFCCGGEIYILDGNINAAAGNFGGAGIGCGYESDRTETTADIYILGGRVKAVSYYWATADVSPDDIGAGANWNGAAADRSDFKSFQTTGTVDGQAVKGNAVIYANKISGVDFADPASIDMPGLFMQEETINGQTVYVGHIYADTVFDAGFTLPADCAGVVCHNGAKSSVGGMEVDWTVRNITFDISKGKVTITPTTYDGYDAAGNNLMGYHNESNKYTITQSNASTATANTITIEDGVTANVTLSGVNISSTSDSPFHVGDTGSSSGTAPAATTVNLTLADGTTNTLKSTNTNAALQTNQNVELHIYGDGTLNATATGTQAAGIGGGGSTNTTWYVGAGTIVIHGGNITARSATYGPAIGEGDSSENKRGASKIYILGGTVRAVKTGLTGFDIGNSGTSASEAYDTFETTYTDKNGNQITGNPVIYANRYAVPPDNRTPGLFIKEHTVNGQKCYVGHVYADTDFDAGFRLPEDCLGVVYHNSAKSTVDGMETDFNAKEMDLYIDKGEIQIGTARTTIDNISVSFYTGYNEAGETVIGLHTEGLKYQIHQTQDAATSNTITVNNGTTADITLNGVNISGTTPLKINSTSSAPSTVKLTLADGTVNTLKGTAGAIQTHASSHLHIYGDGTLNAVTTSTYDACIGGASSDSQDAASGGEIVIWGGNITATSNLIGAAIGDGDDANGKTQIYILGGVVTAKNNGKGHDIGNDDNTDWNGSFSTVYTDGTTYHPVIYATKYSEVPDKGIAAESEPGMFIMEDTFDGTTATVCHIYANTILPENYQEHLSKCIGVMIHNGAKTYDSDGNLVNLTTSAPETFYLNHGSVHIGKDFFWGHDETGDLVVGTDLDHVYRVTQSDTNTALTSKEIIVDDGAQVALTLAGVNTNGYLHIGDTGSRTGTEPSATTVNLHLAEGSTNTFVAPSNYAGVQTNKTSTLVIDGSGALNATGGSSCAGIGSGCSSSSASADSWYTEGGTIIIRDGIITAKGNSWSPGIGCSDRYYNQTQTASVYVLGGTVSATRGSSCSYDIGSSYIVNNNLYNSTMTGGDGKITEYSGGVIYANAYNCTTPEKDQDYGVYVINNVYHVYKTTILTEDLTIPSEGTLYIHDGASLIIPKDITLTNNANTVHASSNGSICLDLGAVYEGTCNLTEKITLKYEIVEQVKDADITYYTVNGDEETQMPVIREDIPHKHYAEERETVRIKYTDAEIGVFQKDGSTPLAGVKEMEGGLAFTMPAQQVILIQDVMNFAVEKVSADTGRHFGLLPGESNSVTTVSNGSFSIAWTKLGYVAPEVSLKFTGGLPADTRLWLFDFSDGSEYYCSVDAETAAIPFGSFKAMGTDTAFDKTLTDVNCQLVVQLPRDSEDTSLTGVSLEHEGETIGAVTVNLTQYTPCTLHVTNVIGGEKQITAEIAASSGILVVTLEGAAYPAGAAVRLDSQPAAIHGNKAMMTAGNGTLTITGLPAGTYTLKAELYEGTDKAHPMAENLLGTETANVTVTERDKLTATTQDSRFLDSTAGGSLTFTTDATKIAVVKKVDGVYNGEVTGITVSDQTVTVAAGTAAGTYRIIFTRDTEECVYNFIVY